MEKEDKSKAGWNGLSFKKVNLFIMLAGALMVALGFVLMSGGGSDDPAVFSPALFSAQRITIAPILIMAGFALNIVGIMKR